METAPAARWHGSGPRWQVDTKSKVGPNALPVGEETPRLPFRFHFFAQHVYVWSEFVPCGEQFSTQLSPIFPAAQKTVCIRGVASILDFLVPRGKWWCLFIFFLALTWLLINAILYIISIPNRVESRGARSSGCYCFWWILLQTDFIPASECTFWMSRE